MRKRKLNLPASNTVVISANEKYLATLGRSIIISNLKERKRLLSIHPFSHPCEAAFSHDEKVLAVKNTSGEIVTINVSNGAVIAKFKPKNNDEGAPIKFSSCDQYLVDASWSGFIRVRKIEDLLPNLEFEFVGEMIVGISKNSDNSKWLFSHQPKTRSGENFPDSPYLTMWEWPLLKPSKTIKSVFDNLYSSALSPCATMIASYGYRRDIEKKEFRITSLDNYLIISLEIETGGSGFEIRWSKDGKLVGVITKTGFSIYDSSTLKMVSHFEAKYPSDMAFIEDNSHIVLGTWENGSIYSLIENQRSQSI